MGVLMVNAPCDPRAERYADVIEQQGFPVIVRHRDPGSYDPATRALAQGPPLHEVETHAIVSAFEHREVNGTSVQVGDMRATVSAVALDWELAPGDEIEMNGDTWRVLNVGPQTIGATVAAYAAHIRK